MFLGFGGAKRAVVASVGPDWLDVRGAVGQRNGRWKVSQTIRRIEVPARNYLISEIAPETDDPCD